MSYLTIRHANRSGGLVEYQVVDLPEVCEAGRAIFHDDPNIQFHTALPERDIRFDVATMSTALQYFADYTETLRALAAYQARYLLLESLHGGEIPTFATAQCNISGSIIPCWFFNVREIIALLGGWGYDLILDSRSAWPHDQSNFPETHRLKNSRTLLFAQRSRS